MSNTANTSSAINTNNGAFNAYGVLYYDIIGNVIPADIDATTVSVSDDDIALALTVNENMSGSGYTLSDRSIAALAYVYACARSANKLYEILTINPAADIYSFLPDAKYTPMYPDFPSQVLNMSEFEFRRDQILHYASTYGVELLAKTLFDADAEVKQGYMPDVENTPKEDKGEQLIPDKVVELVLSRDAMLDMIASDARRPKRMSTVAIDLLADLAYEQKLPQDFPDFAFHENANALILAVSSAPEYSSTQIQEILDRFCQNPGDIIKAINSYCELATTNHLSTKQKKAFCRALNNYDAASIAKNIADLSDKGQQAINRLSVARFGGDALTTAKKLVDERKVVSYNSELEKHWKEYLDVRNGYTSTQFCGGDEVILDALEDQIIKTYEKRPGIMLRSIARMITNGIPYHKVASAVSAHINDYSMATLVTLCTNMSATDTNVEKNFMGASDVQDIADQHRRAMKKSAYTIIASLTSQLIAARLAKLDTPFKNKKVYFDKGNFSLEGSLIMPNLVGNTENAYPPAGIAYDVPQDNTLRFFTFWNDDTHRVDVDTHFFYKFVDGSTGHIGWNSHYKNDGIVFSGDITTSQNSAEYIDVDMKEALANNVKTIHCNQHIYCGARNWKDIQECFCGALVVGDTTPDATLYRSDNVLFHDDMNGTGDDLAYSVINVPQHYVRIMRGSKLPFNESQFTADVYVKLLLAAQGVELVEDEKDADVIVSFGRKKDIVKRDDGEEIPSVCLIDEKFYIE